jgi:hypothetical protein
LLGSWAARAACLADRKVIWHGQMDRSYPPTAAVSGVIAWGVRNAPPIRKTMDLHYPSAAPFDLLRSPRTERRTLPPSFLGEHAVAPAGGAMPVKSPFKNGPGSVY